MSKIEYIKGDATNPQDENNIKIIAHVSNNKGGWGAGFVLALSKKWSKPEEEYRKTNNYILGLNQVVPVTDDIIVVNMIAQDGYRSENNPVPINYSALRNCLTNLDILAKIYNASIHMPKIGSGLGGGDWNTIEKIIEENITGRVIVYGFE